MQVFFATNRDPLPDDAAPATFGPHFHPKGPGFLRVGVATLLTAPGAMPPLADPPALSGITVYPDLRAGEGGTRYGSADLVEAVSQVVFEGDRAIADVLLYVHGYDTTFDEALRFAGQAALNINAQVALVAGEGDVRPVVPLVFSWPSDGVLVPELSYWGDRREAKDSGAALARVIRKLAQYLDDRLQAAVLAATGRARPTTRDWRDAMREGRLDCGVRIHMLTQSMGAFVLGHGMLDLIDEIGGALPRPFDQVILSAPDEDADALEGAGRLRRLPELCQRVTVYFNRRDKALLISETSKHWSRRLGQGGPSGVIGEATLFVVDVEPVIGQAAGDLPGHYYNRLNPRVQQDVLRVFAEIPADAIGGRRPLERQRYRLF